MLSDRVRLGGSAAAWDDDGGRALLTFRREDTGFTFFRRRSSAFRHPCIGACQLSACCCQAFNMNNKQWRQY